MDDNSGLRTLAIFWQCCHNYINEGLDRVELIYLRITESMTYSDKSTVVLFSGGWFRSLLRKSAFYRIVFMSPAKTRQTTRCYSARCRDAIISLGLIERLVCCCVMNRKTMRYRDNTPHNNALCIRQRHDRTAETHAVYAISRRANVTEISHHTYLIMMCGHIFYIYYALFLHLLLYFKHDDASYDIINTITKLWTCFYETRDPL